MSRRSTPAARLKPGGFLFIAVLLFAVTACAPLQSERLLKSASALDEPVELNTVPFFAQEEYQCGPAALATLLTWSKVEITPEQLTPQVYLPSRQGSLQIEIVAATRRHGRVPYVLQPQLESIFAEIASGNPVLVLQNLGLSFAPTWHYAVVVGFDLDAGEVVLRSGRERRHVVAMRTFERTWARGNYWAMVALAPEQLPYTAEELPYLRSVAPFEHVGAHSLAASAYSSALQRWPRSLAASIGLGNARYALGDLAGAEAALRNATRTHPDSAAAFNNLAQTLSDRGRHAEAENLARQALTLAQDDALRAVVQQTLDTIIARRGGAGTKTGSP